MDLDFLKNELRFSSGKMFVALEKRTLLKPKFTKDPPEFDWSKNGNVLDWHRKHIYRMFFFKFLNIVYFLCWCRTCETVLGMSYKKLCVVLFLIFY